MDRRVRRPAGGRAAVARRVLDAARPRRRGSALVRARRRTRGDVGGREGGAPARRCTRRREGGRQLLNEQFAHANGIELCYETFGDRSDPALLLIMGLGTQMVAWREDFCRALADRGFLVI